MVTKVRVSESWVTKAIVSRLKKLVMAYIPTGKERERSLRELFSGIDLSWQASYESRTEPKIEWIAIPVITKLFKDPKTDETRVITLTISFIRSYAGSDNIFFCANEEVFSFQYVEQGLIIMQNLESVINEVRDEISQERLKLQKVRLMVEGSAEAVIIDALRGKDLSYHMIFLQDLLELRILFPYDREAVFTIPYNHFGDYISCLPAQIEHILQAIVGFPFSLKKAETKIKWIRPK